MKTKATKSDFKINYIKRVKTFVFTKFSATGPVRRRVSAVECSLASEAKPAALP
jgi:hypothetical protein